LQHASLKATLDAWNILPSYLYFITDIQLLNVNF